LIFEQPSVDPGKRREYRVLKVEFQETENFADQKMDIDLTPSSKETIKTLNSLVKEGFVVRDLFVSDDVLADKASVLLERIQ
jgi:thiazole synthase ThiGH ThiG subunit